jgi:hypothetical protein
MKQGKFASGEAGNGKTQHMMVSNHAMIEMCVKYKNVPKFQ